MQSVSAPSAALCSNRKPDSRLSKLFHMIRETDTAVYTGDCRTISEKKVSDLKNRAAAVNATPNALLISIHQNFFPEGKYRGTQVFYARTDGSEALAKRIQDTVRETVDPNNHRQIKKSQAVYLMGSWNTRPSRLARL